MWPNKSNSVLRIKVPIRGSLKAWWFNVGFIIPRIGLVYTTHAKYWPNSN